MTNILDASSAIITPYSASKLKMTVSCLNIDANKAGDGEVERRTRTARRVGGTADPSVGAGGAQLAAAL